jgi:septum formation inhibitor MinC
MGRGDCILKCRQYNVKVFEVGVEEPESFIEFIEANYILIKNHLLSIKGNRSEKVISYLEEKGLRYVWNMDLPLPKRGVEELSLVSSALESGDGAKDEATADGTETLEPLKIVAKALRSGQCIEHNGDVLSTDRINSGAKIAALGSVVALGKVEGDISSAGECIIITPTKRGNILFHGRKIENEKLIYPLNLIRYIGEKIVIESLEAKQTKRK